MNSTQRTTWGIKKNDEERQVEKLNVAEVLKYISKNREQGDIFVIYPPPPPAASKSDLTELEKIPGIRVLRQ